MGMALDIRLVKPRFLVGEPRVSFPRLNRFLTAPISPPVALAEVEAVANFAAVPNSAIEATSLTPYVAANDSNAGVLYIPLPSKEPLPPDIAPNSAPSAPCSAAY